MERCAHRLVKVGTFLNMRILLSGGEREPLLDDLRSDEGKRKPRDRGTGITKVVIAMRGRLCSRQTTICC